MKAPEVRLQGAVTASTATAVTLTTSGSRDAGALGTTVTTVVINGTGMAGIAVGDRLEVRVRAM